MDEYYATDEHGNCHRVSDRVVASIKAQTLREAAKFGEGEYCQCSLLCRKLADRIEQEANNEL